MKVVFIDITAEFVGHLDESDRVRVTRVREFFEEKGFIIGPKYVKKVSKYGIWELRAGSVRLFLFIKGDLAVCIHAVLKKSQKLKVRDIKLAEKRSKKL